MPLGTEIYGLPFVQHMLKDLFPRETRGVLRQTMLGIAAEMRNEMRKAAPKDKGTLRKAIVAKRRRGRQGTVEAIVLITHGKGEKHDAFYWHMVDRGTEHSEAKPFTQDVIEERKKTYRQDVRRVLRQKVLKRLERRAARQKR